MPGKDSYQKVVLLVSMILGQATVLMPFSLLAAQGRAAESSGSSVFEVSSAPAAPKTEIVRIPVGTRLPITLIDGIIAGSTTDGDVIHARLNSDIHLRSGHVIPTGTLILGHADAVATKSPLFNGPSTVQVSFDQLRISDATMIPFAATIVAGIHAEQKRAMLCGLRSNVFGESVADEIIDDCSNAPTGTAIGALENPSRRQTTCADDASLASSAASSTGCSGTLKGLLVRSGTSLSFPAGQTLVLELNAPAQVVVQGGYL